MVSKPRTTHPIGDSNITHPIITFRVNLERNLDESIGPNLNSKSVSVLHPDMYDNSPERGRTNTAQHTDNKSTLLPGFLAGDNIVQIDNNTIVAYGQRATYLMNTYTKGSNPILELVSVEAASTM
jgi:hypothetical protein